MLSTSSRYSVSQSAGVAGLASGTRRRAASSARSSTPSARSSAAIRGRKRSAHASSTSSVSMALQTLGVSVDVDVAHAFVVLDHGHARMLRDEANEALSAARNREVDDSAEPHEH